MPFKPRFPGEYPTLGYGVIEWMERVLATPDKAEYVPLRLYREQAEFILKFYRLDPVTGRRQYNRGLLGRPRGWGKSPFAAGLCAVEGLGPVVFSHWDDEGQPVGKPWASVRTPVIQIAAVSEQQTANTYDALLEMLREGPATEMYPSLRPHDTVTLLPRGRIEQITTSPRSVKGSRAVFGVMDQALALDTPIPTPSGWTTMGELQSDDVIYGSDGPVTVSEAKPVSTEHDCYRVSFQDGTSVVASAGHLWMSRRSGWSGLRKDEVRTTQQMAECKYRYRVPLAPIQEAPEIALPADPYLLGLWLGDGTRGKCEFAVAEEDKDVTCGILASRGIETTPRMYSYAGTGYGTRGAWNVSFSSLSGYQGATRPQAAKEIAALPCYRDKHVPEEFFRGSVTQRLDLLRGLMDADGCATTQGVCTFVNTNRRLAEAVTRLLRSLGQVTSGVKTIYDDRYTDGMKFRVDFTPRQGVNPFNLPRKRDRVKGNADKWVNIVSIEKVERVPVRCIAVDSEDHLFAFGVSGHLTHNTEEWVRSNHGIKLAQVMRANSAKVGGAVIETPNAFIPGENSVAEAAAAYAELIRTGQAKNDALLYDHREAPPDTDMAERESLTHGLRVAYGCSSGHPDGCVIHDPPCAPGHVGLESLISTIWTPDQDPQQSRSDFLNQVTHASDSWISSPVLRAVVDPEKVVSPGDTIVLGFDGSRGRVRGKADATALMGMRVSDKHLFEVAVWEAGPNDGQDWAPNPLEVDATVRDCFERFRVVGFYADPSGWTGQVAEWEAAFGKRLRVKASRNAPIAAWPRGKDSRVGDLVERLRQAIAGEEISMSESPRLISHMLHARRRTTRSGYLLYKAYPESPDKIDAAYAAVMAYSACLDAIAAGIGTGPRKPRKKRRAVFA